jgi:hypothetical protein
MTPDELLQRIAQTLKKEVGPAVEGAYPRTQAFLAAAVLEKLARQLHLAESHAAAEASDMASLVEDLKTLAMQLELPQPVQAAIAAVVARRDGPALSGLIEALYAERTALGAKAFEALLGRVRRSLRAAIDRQAAYSS